MNSSNLSGRLVRERAVAAIDRKHQLARSGAKSAAHRYERRRIREQLRHLDWALTGAD